MIIKVLQELVGRMEEMERRLDHMIVSGTVSETDHSTGLYKIEYGDDDNKVESPWLRPQEHAGTISSHMPFKKGQQVHMLSKGGEIGKQSWIVPAGHSDANPRHSDDGDAPSWKVGNSEFVMKEGEILITSDVVRLNGQIIHNNGNRRVAYEGAKDIKQQPLIEGADDVFV